MNLEELLQQAESGNMVAQYNLAEYYGKLLKETENEDEIFKYSREAMLWLKKSAKQGYGPAMDAVSELNVRPDAAEQPDEMDAAAETMAAAVAAAMDGLDAGYPAVEASAPEKRGSAAEPVEPAEQPAGGGRSGANLALACMLAISLLLNILLLIFLFKLTRERRVQPAPTPPVVSEAPEASEAPQVTPGITPEVTPEPTPEATPEITPEPTPEVTEEPFWLDLTAYPELELKPAQDELYDAYDYYVVTADSLNVRSGPDTRYQRLGTVSMGTKVGVVSKYGTWYLVNFAPDRFGWVSGQYLTNDLSWTPPVSTPAPTPTVTAEPKPEATPAATSEPAPEATPAATAEPEPEATPEPTPEPTPEQTPPPGGLASPSNLR